MKLVVSLFFCLCISGCNSINSEYFSETSELNEFEIAWFSKHLYAAKESPLNETKHAKSYRFTWLRTFHAPVVIRIDCDKKCTLESKKLSGAGGYEPGKIESNKRFELTENQSNRFRSLFEKVDGWNFKPDEEIIGMDGSQWIFEYSSSHSYQFWNLWSPSGRKRAEDYVSMCLFLLENSKLKIDENYIY